MLRVVEFKTQYRPGKDPVDMVLLAPSGPAFERQQSWHRVAKLVPPENVDEAEKQSQKYQHMAARWSVVGPAYDEWKKGNQIPENGIPLAAWSGVTTDQAAFLRKMGIRTVEDVRDMGEQAISALNWPDSRKLPALARAYLEGEAAAEKDAKISNLEEQIEVMRQMLEEQKPKRGPGRPKKEEVDA